MFAKGVETK